MKKIVFRFDANQVIGYGHYVRCQALADQLRLQGDVEIKFLMRILVDTSYEIIPLTTEFHNTESNHYVYESIENELDEFVNILKEEKPDCLVVDHYGVSKHYFEYIRPYLPVIVALDDCNEEYQEYPVDMILNGNCYAKRLHYGMKKQLLVGSEYAILRTEFSQCGFRSIREKVEEITITTGGSDPLGVTCDLVKAMNEIEYFRGIRKNVVIGSGFSKNKILEIEEEASNGWNFQLHYHADMKALMELSDLCITSSGSTLNELAATGTPSVSFILSEDQRMVGETMQEKGITHNVGWYHEIDLGKFMKQIEAVAENPSMRREMAENGQRAVDGRGTVRAAKKILECLQEGSL